MLKKMRAYFVLLLTVILIVTSCIGCGKKIVEKDKNTIILWCNLDAKMNAIIQEVANKWGKENGKKIKVETLFNPWDYEGLASKPIGPDLVIGLPSDQLWKNEKMGLIDYMPKELIDETKYNKNALKAVQMGDKRIGMPIYMETSTLIYNAEKISAPPTNMEEFLNEAEKVGFSYDINSFYLSYTFLAGNGAYVFKENNGSYDAKNIGLGSKSAVDGFKMLQNFINEYNFMRPIVSRDEAIYNFNTGKSGLYIGTPNDVNALKKANVKLATTTIPKINGNTPASFISTSIGFVNSKSSEKNESWKLLKFITENLSDEFYKNSYVVPVLNSQIENIAKTNDPILSGFIQQTLKSEPIPNIKEMSVVWDSLSYELKLLSANKVSPEVAAKEVMEEIEKEIRLKFVD